MLRFIITALFVTLFLICSIPLFFFPDHGDLHTGNKQNHAERPVHDREGTAVLDIHIELPDDPFNDEF